ncbi:hypothetical protein [Pseudomonas monteilii]|uniref:hypothetical protein n=1 Tax=Pseudomonas monteilii TaxID=76759 RepID=UPI001E3A6822|nr:hypothetical protein [Pseudomonas monteilii]MCE0930372.1 hypothetical protein [Pseudomonas monteilii]MCE0976083.1 hypothetical protein [Pseudomonas monteilii]MCE1040460.1 hypothetical protein [Pseudomonas monteilii]WJN87706.1 hypothetical protein LU680_26365 [Pseudomonas monteilii]WJO32560.1 hypothetical protein LU690_26435 [Pseudomonas monteilii]
MNVRNFIAFLTLLFLPVIAFADDATQARVELISANIGLIKLVVFLIGFITFVSGGYKLILLTEQGGKMGKSVPLVYILVGTILMSLTTSISVFGNTLFKAGDFCFVVAEGSIDNACMNTEVSGLTGELQSRVEKLSSGSTAKQFMQNIQIIIGIFQIIGFIYFAIGAYGLAQVANGSSKENGYGKPIITMFASALIVDIPHTAQMAIDTLERIGINF